MSTPSPLRTTLLATAALFLAVLAGLFVTVLVVAIGLSNWAQYARTVRCKSYAAPAFRSIFSRARSTAWR